MIGRKCQNVLKTLENKRPDPSNADLGGQIFTVKSTRNTNTISLVPSIEKLMDRKCQEILGVSTYLDIQAGFQPELKPSFLPVSFQW